MKIFLILLAAIMFAFGFWYLMFWFITAESNMLKWHMLAKVVYLVLSFASTNGVIDGIEND